jgi:hypothetical protein
MLVAPGESVDDLEALRAQLLEEHAPQSRLTFELVDRLAAILWRLRRIPRWETGLIYARNVQAWDGAPAEHWTDNPEDEQFEWKTSVRYGLLLTRDAAKGDAFGKLSRYEATLMKALEKTLKLLSEATEKGSAISDRAITIETPLTH